jgi:1,4-dihydroxy-2-naphthoyl-CoA hydrolase
MTIAAEASGILRAMPFAATLGVEIDGVRPEEVSARLAWAPGLCTAGGVLHGGALMALADSLGGICASLNLPPGATTSTIESKTNFFRPVRRGAVHATARPVHVGRATIVVQTDLADEAGCLVARVTQTQAVIAPPRAEEASDRRGDGAKGLDVRLTEEDVGA